MATGLEVGGGVAVTRQAPGAAWDFSFVSFPLTAADLLPFWEFTVDAFAVAAAVEAAAAPVEAESAAAAAASATPAPAAAAASSCSSCHNSSILVQPAQSSRANPIQTSRLAR